jgi:hypothetical protein
MIVVIRIRKPRTFEVVLEAEYKSAAAVAQRLRNDGHNARVAAGEVIVSAE